MGDLSKANEALQLQGTEVESLKAEPKAEISREKDVSNALSSELAALEKEMKVLQDDAAAQASRSPDDDKLSKELESEKQKRLDVEQALEALTEANEVLINARHALEKQSEEDKEKRVTLEAEVSDLQSRLE